MQSQIFFYSMIFQQLIHSLQLNLRKLILLLAIFSVISLFIISIHSISHFIGTYIKLLNYIILLHSSFCPYGQAF